MGDLVVPIPADSVSSSDYYSTPDAVIQLTGISVGTIPGIDDSGDLTTYLEGVLLRVSDMMDHYWAKQNQASYLTDDPRPAGVDGIAADMASTVVRNAIVGQSSEITRIDDFVAKVVTLELLTDEVKEQLKLYASGGGAGTVDFRQDTIADLSGDTIIWED